jgi:GNAT superfamily N-acetyltransferase
VPLQPRDLGDGLVLRSARLADGAELAEFNAAMHSDENLSGSALADWTSDLFELPHPTFRPERDVTLVEDTASGRIVSALFLVPQRWSYAGIEVLAGQPELIATHPDYRRRGLIRAQFDVVHEWSRAAGQLWQFIGGIPWYYRQFGYVYALDVPPRPIMWLREAEPASPAEFALRPATPADAGALAEIESDGSSGIALSPVRGADGFAVELARRPGSVCSYEILVIEHRRDTSSPVGFVAHLRQLRDGLAVVQAFEVRRGTSWLEPTAAVLAHLHHWVREHPDGPGRGIRLLLPVGHPVRRSAATRLGTGPAGSYGYYVRVPDVVAVLGAIAPALEARLAASPAVGWTGALNLDLYRECVRLRFEEGRLIAVERSDAAEATVDACVPAEDFLHLLFGNRPIAELERTVADCLIRTDAGALLLDVLFPPMPSSTWEFC